MLIYGANLTPRHSPHIAYFDSVDFTAPRDAFMMNGLPRLSLFPDLLEQFSEIVFLETEGTSFMMRKESPNSVACYAGSNNNRMLYSYPFARLDLLGNVEMLFYTNIPAWSMYKTFFAPLNIVRIPNNGLNTYGRVDVQAQTVHRIKHGNTFAQGQWWQRYDDWLNRENREPGVFNHIVASYTSRVLQDFELSRRD